MCIRQEDRIPSPLVFTAKSVVAILVSSLLVAADVVPNGSSVVPQGCLAPVLFAIEQESSKSLRVEVLDEEPQEGLVEFECLWELDLAMSVVGKVSLPTYIIIQGC